MQGVLCHLCSFHKRLSGAGCGVLLLLMCFSTEGWGQYLAALTDPVLTKVEKKYGGKARLRVSNWRKLMSGVNASATPIKESSKLNQSNDFFNQIVWVSDKQHWGKEDYWATPIEMLGTNGGDCEDFSIAKYFTLKDISVKTSKLRITYVKALAYNQAHMVLAYYPTPSSDPLIMDNINKKILPASKRRDLLPVFGFNGENLWLAKNRNKKLKNSSQKSLPQWRRLNQKLLSEVL